MNYNTLMPAAIPLRAWGRGLTVRSSSQRFGAAMWWQQRLGEFVTLFLVINPSAAPPTFLDIAATLDPRAQRRLALDAVLISFAVLVFFVFAGAFLRDQMNISIRAFQISGGILLFIIALDMIRGQSLTSGTAAE